MQENDDKDLEISRLRREAEETSKKNKSLNEKVIDYQGTNERLRKDKAALDEKFQEVKRELEMQKLMAKNAMMANMRDNSSEDSDDERGRRKN